MTRHLPDSPKDPTGISARRGESELPPFDSPDPINPDPQNRWARGIVYFSAVIGLALAALMILRPSDTSKDPRAQPSICSPSCR